MTSAAQSVPAEFRRAELPDTVAANRAINRVAEAVHRLNEAVQRAVSTGVSVELVRVSRHHDGSGNWGDQVVPMIRSADASGSNLSAADA